MSPRLLWPELAPEDSAQGWIADLAAPVAAADVCAALARRHDPGPSIGGYPGRWVFLREVQAATGNYSDTQRFDAVAVGLVPSVKYARVVYEVKVSRSDWLHELKPVREVFDERGRRQYGWKPDAIAKADEPGYEWARGLHVRERLKWQAALDCSTEFYFAAPPQVILEHEVPPEAGLIEVRPWGKQRQLRARVIRPAPVRATPLPGAGWWASVLRRAAGPGLHRGADAATVTDNSEQQEVSV